MPPIKLKLLAPCTLTPSPRLPVIETPKNAAELSWMKTPAPLLMAISRRVRLLVSITWSIVLAKLPGEGELPHATAVAFNAADVTGAGPA